ncbi:MAG: alkaline phosphatase family protein [Xanthomonadaceae bacterium]|nr:alkaline phosphatase family protein [Xanthomonadaceae bacterium]
MKILFRLLALALLPLLAACAGTPPRTDGGDRPVPLLLISIDGYRHDYLDRGFSPVLASLARDGVRATSMQPSFPSLTFPNHYTLVTGLRPDHHGIVHNTMEDPQLGHFDLKDRKAVSDGRWWDEATPLWVSADRHGVKTATMFWPGTEADIHGMHPDHWRPYDGKVTADQRVDQVLAWLDLPPAQRPGFLTLYFDAVDHAGHDAGPDSPQVNQALRDTDEALGRLVAGLKQRGLFDRINFIVVSDHGMATVPPGHVVLLDDLLPLDRVDLVTAGVLAGINPKPGTDFAAIEARMVQPHPHMQCWDKSRVPARLHYGHNPRVPQLLCLADVGWTLSTRGYIGEHGAMRGKRTRGEHGYDNADPRMGALFVAHGPAFERGVVHPAFPNVDVYPLMAHLLHIVPERNDGDYRQVEDMLVPAAR